MRAIIAIIGIVVLIGIVAVAFSGGDGPSTPVGLPEGDPVRGAVLFEQRCAACHGVDAGGTDAGPPLVDPIYRPDHHGDLAFLLAVRRGVQPHHWSFGPMPAQPGLSEQDVADIVAHVRQLQRAAGIR